MSQITNSEPIPDNFVWIAWTNSSPCCPYKGIPKLCLSKSINNLMKIEQKMSTVWYKKSSFARNSIRLQPVNFFKESRKMYNCSITNYTLCILIKDAWWNKMKRKLLPFRVVYGMSSISSTLRSNILKKNNKVEGKAGTQQILLQKVSPGTITNSFRKRANLK